MVGRAVYHDPYFLAKVDQEIYGDEQTSNVTRMQILARLLPYVQGQLDKGVPLKAISRHLLGLFQGVKGAKAWRRYISENAYKKQSGVEVLERAASFIEE
jgi:tRNA-dihydrouridine synthase A